MIRSRILRVSVLFASITILMISLASVFAAPEVEFKIGQELLVSGHGDEQVSIYPSPSTTSPSIAALQGGIVVQITTDPKTIDGIMWLRVRSYPLEGWVMTKESGISNFTLWSDELYQKISTETLSYSTQNSSDAKAFYQLGIVYMDRGLYDDAISAFNRANELHINKALARYFRGLAFYYLNRHSEALRDLNAAIKLDSRPLFFYTLFGNIHETLGNEDQAIVQYNKAIRSDSNYLPARNSLGIAYYNLGYYQDAVEEFNYALAIDPLYARAYSNRANAYLKMGDVEAAIRDYKQAIASQPNTDIAMSNLASLYFDMGDYSESIAVANQAISVTPNNTEMDAYLFRGISSIALGREAEGEADLKHIIDRGTDKDATADAFYNLGNLYHRQHKYQLAVDHFSKAIDIIPSYLAAYQNRGISYEWLGNYDAAIGDFNQALALEPNFPLAYIERCNVYYKLQSYAAAIEDCSTALKLYPNQKEALLHRGYSYGFSSQETKAITDFELLIEIDSDNAAEYYQYIGYLYFRLKRYQEAVKAFDRYIQLEPNPSPNFLVFIQVLRGMLIATP